MATINATLSRLCQSIIRCYQFAISPILGQHCRFYPSCSHYMAQAITHHGLWYGLWLGTKRLLRCHPWHEGGVDEIPLPKLKLNHYHKR